MAAGLYNFIVTEMGGLCLFCYGKEPDLQGRFYCALTLD